MSGTRISHALAEGKRRGVKFRHDDVRRPADGCGRSFEVI